MVTLQVKIQFFSFVLGSFGAGDKQEHGGELCADFSLWIFGDRKGATKKLCDKDFAKPSGELSGAICLKTPCFTG